MMLLLETLMQGTLFSVATLCISEAARSYEQHVASICSFGGNAREGINRSRGNLTQFRVNKTLKFVMVVY
jgi:hypothetical protein